VLFRCAPWAGPRLGVSRANTAMSPACLGCVFDRGSLAVSKTRLSIVCIGLAAGWLAMVNAGASAQEWRRGEYEYFKEAHKFGPHCEYGIGAKGSAPIKFFGGAHEVKKAELRSIGDWEYEAGRLFGPQYAHWDLAADKRVHCETKGLDFVCSAIAHPCRPH